MKHIPKQLEGLVLERSESSRDSTLENGSISQYGPNFKRSNPEALTRSKSQSCELLRYDLSLQNTLTRSRMTLSKTEQPSLKLYTCGPTVYNFAHIGNLRTYIFEDLLRRTLEYFGFEVKHVMNLTDVDDKTLRGAIKKNISLEAFTKPYKEAFFEDLKCLHILRAHHYPEATAFIPQMIHMIETLIDKGMAYTGGDGSVYFSIAHFPKYGCLSHLNLDELQTGQSKRVASDEYDKENASDFVLWKSYEPERDGKIYWDSPFGPGRPGWHLECSTMAQELLGESVDIHCGGVDNIFPHHENEIAQSEACTGKPFVKLWMHSEHLIVDGKKMSKSLGNFYTLRDLLKKGFTGVQVRYLLLQTHYRTQLNFTFEGLEGAKNSIDRFQSFLFRIKEVRGEEGNVSELIEQSRNAFALSLADDLNISAALAVVFDLIRECNSLADRGKLSQFEGEKLLNFFKEINQVLGIFDFSSQTAVPKELEEALIQREAARKEKNWKESDRLRELIFSAGFQIEDTPSGPRLKKS